MWIIGTYYLPHLFSLRDISPTYNRAFFWPSEFDQRRLSPISVAEDRPVIRWTEQTFNFQYCVGGRKAWHVSTYTTMVGQ